ncbi:AbgT family transporter, partial [Cobetia sp. SIMBA_158]
GWYITDKIIEPRLQNTPLDGNSEDLPVFEDARSDEKRAFFIASSVMIAGIALLAYVSAPVDSAMRSSDGSLTNFRSPLMQSIVPLIFLLFWI